MSRSNPQLTNPAKRYFKWSGSTGELSYYDKEKKEDFVVHLPFRFLVLDQLATITGFSEPDQSSYWSNEVRSVAREEFSVRTSKGNKQSGFYRDLTDVRSKGAKYTKSIYIAYHQSGEDGWVIGNLKASGAALTAWIEFSKECIVENGKIVLTGSTEATKGSNTYRIPTFEYFASDAEEDGIAIDLDKELQIYLSQYLAVADKLASDAADNDEAEDEMGAHTPSQPIEPIKRSVIKESPEDVNPEDEQVPPPDLPQQDEPEDPPMPKDFLKYDDDDSKNIKKTSTKKDSRISVPELATIVDALKEKGYTNKNEIDNILLHLAETDSLSNISHEQGVELLKNVRSLSKSLLDTFFTEE